MVKYMSDNLEKESYISQAFGYDGSLNMIKKAQANYPDVAFSQGDLNFWNPNQKFDIIYSMEVIYYLKSPEKFIQECYKNWLNPGGIFITEELDFPDTRDDMNEKKQKPTLRDILIKMNEPLRYKGHTFYQASFIEGKLNDTSVLAVVKNYGRLFPYISSIIMCFGLLVHMILKVSLRFKRIKSES